jgi:hypothetical protein
MIRVWAWSGTMTFRALAFLTLAVSGMALSACATEEGYRQHMSLELGRSTDDVLVRWGPPQNRTEMSNGRQLWSYTKTTVDEREGYYRDEVREVKRTFTDKDGKQKTETISETFPVWQPPQVYRSTCTTRFVMGGGRVEDVTFDGDGCVAEELS